MISRTEWWVRVFFAAVAIALLIIFLQGIFATLLAPLGELP